MRTALFLLAILLLLALGGFTLLQQQRQVASLRAQLQRASTWQTSNSSNHVGPSPVPQPESATKESELLRLRGEVSLLRRDLEATAAGALSRRRAEDDWALVHSGAKPSDYPDFVFFTNCVSAGFGTPATALQSFYSAMRNQAKEPLNPTRMKQLWDVPDDFDEPGAGYSIDIGEGMGREDGYRIVSQEPTGSNGLILTLEFELPDGSSSRRNVTMVERTGLWRMKPARVSRAKPGQ